MLNFDQLSPIGTTLKDQSFFKISLVIAFKVSILLGFIGITAANRTKVELTKNSLS